MPAFPSWCQDAFIVMCVLIPVLLCLIWGQQKRLRDGEISHQKALSKAILDTQEEERQRIGMDLHDGVGAMLATLRLKTDNIIADNNISVDEKKKMMKEFIDKISNNVRKLSHQLSPDILIFYSLGEAVELLFDGVKTSIFQVNYDTTELFHLNVYDTNDSIYIYRIIEELIQNTIKHADASFCELKIYRDAIETEILYADNGKGIEPERNAKGIGMKNIYIRIELMGGKFSVNQLSEMGFNFMFSLPNSIINNGKQNSYYNC